MTFLLIAGERENPAMKVVREVILQKGGGEVWAQSPQEALRIADRSSPQLALVDFDHLGEEAFELIRRLKSKNQRIRVALTSSQPSLEGAMRAIRVGAEDFIPLPQKEERLKSFLEESLKMEANPYSLEGRGFEGIIGDSPKLRKVLEIARRVSQSLACTVLIRGETGTGKGLLCRAIHCSSQRAEGPFIELNCTAIPETLLEAELFGHEKGAYTDAKERKLGLLELANKGTIFLDEVGNMSLNIQAKLLNAIEERKFKRLGGTEDIRVDIRVVAATNKDLESAVKEQTFREDLYYRLNVVSLRLPPLRERDEDVILLAQYFIQKYNREFNRRVRGLTPEVERFLLSHDWPGNVRELKNFIERAVLLGEEEFITPGSMTSDRCSPKKDDEQEDDLAGLVISLPEMERNLILRALRLTKGNRSQAARLLDISRPRLLRKIEKYSLRADHL